jgi:hypothetical protein
MTRIRALKAQLESSQLQCDSLARRLEAAAAAEDLLALTRLWETALQEHNAVQSALILLEQQEGKSATHC